MESESISDCKKSHRKARAGRKVNKKTNKPTDIQTLDAKQRNPKAFAINSAVRAERVFRRHQDLDTKKQRIPSVDRTPHEPPPIVIAIVGPPKVGKSTLVKCLIKHFTRQPLTAVKGPVTVVSGKRRRITLIECCNDISSMIDVAKIADLVLLLIDGSFGFEMEIFEFLNICQVHGMPKIMGILTHLDLIKNSKVLRHTKKALKHRFWTEVYPGAKLFHLSGILHGEYLRNEIERLARFVSVMKFRPLIWQTSHPYILVDRMEDLTSPDLIRRNPKCDRTISLYGYVRGIPFYGNNHVHIAGCGDYKIANISLLSDPCPLPDKLKKRTLVDKERLIYAPFSGVGGIVYDKDAVYVELAGSHSHRNAPRNDEEQPKRELVSFLVKTKESLENKLERSELQLYSNASPIIAREFDDERSVEDIRFQVIEDHRSGQKRRKIVFADEQFTTVDGDVSNDDEEEEEYESGRSDDDGEECDSEDESHDEENENNEHQNFDNFFNSERKFDDFVKCKINLSQKASDSFVARQNTSTNLCKLVYDCKKAERNFEKENDEEMVDGLFKVISARKKQLLQERDTLDAEDCSRFVISVVRSWSSEELTCESVSDYFVTGKRNTLDDADELLKLDDVIEDGQELFGDFEDFDARKMCKEEEINDLKYGKSIRKFDETEILFKKIKLKEKFNAEYDEKEGDGTEAYYNELKQDVTKQAELNRVEFEGLDDEARIQREGFRPGLYVRLEFKKIPCELVENFDPVYPLIIGGLQPGEENIGYVNVRIKKHRWYNRILKSNDPIIISLGWRKFQTLPVYYKLEDDFRQRMLKYTPEHVTCMANFWGPVTKPGTGFLVVQSVMNGQEGFRIIATGTVVDTNQSTRITKKLKLVGEPLKIYKKTAFVKNMFGSALEVAKFEGAKIKTVSGIRGQIKRACSKPEGVFRATFEDVVKLSDIVFCRTWCNVDVPKWYNPVTSLLSPTDQKAKWLGMKTSGQLKNENGVKNSQQLDSFYSDVNRGKKIFKPITIPKRLQNQLPFKDKPKSGKIGAKNSVTKNRLATIRDTHHYKIASLLKMIKINYQEKQGKLKREMKDRLNNYRKIVKLDQESRHKKEKERKKEKYIKQTKLKSQL